MLEKTSRFCTKFPWLVFLVVAAITVLMAQQIREKAYFEADMIKFLPTDMPAVKSDDYSKKNFNTQDTMLIGIESKDGTILSPAVMRAMENIVLELKNLKASKTFDSMLEGKTVTLHQPVGVDPDSISSIANLEDAVLDKSTGSVVSGSVVEKLKNDFNIVSQPGEEERLPGNDEDLLRVLPGLKKRVMEDRTFRGSILSEDLKSATIRVSVLRKGDYKRRFAVLELSTAINENALKLRFQGKDSTFPYTIYGKRIGGFEIDNGYIGKHSENVKKELSDYLWDTLKPVFSDEPQLKTLLEKELTVESFQAIMQHTERNDFFLHPKIGTWRSFTDGIYEFMLEEIDPYSRENLEFQLHNVKSVVDMAEIYTLANGILEKHLPAGVNSYVAGTPVVIGVFSQMMTEDMKRLIPIAIGVVIIILILSFRSVMGVFIPLITVLLAVIWTLGIMAFLKVPFTVSTSGLPIIILAVGTAYGIHLLNRYYEDARFFKDKFEIVQNSIKHVGGAIFMAAVTTVAGFSSLATTSLTAIQHFGQFSAVGVIIALALSLTLTPALLVLWKVPSTKRLNNGPGKNGGFIADLMLSWSRLVIARPKTVLLLFVFTVIAALSLMKQNYFEGSMLSNFKEDNVISQSDRFLNKELTGTTDVNLIFTFRDRVNLENTDIQRQLRERVSDFINIAAELPLNRNDPAKSMLEKMNRSLLQSVENLPASTESLLTQLKLIENVLDEEYLVLREMDLSRQQTMVSEQENNLPDQLDSDDDLSGLDDGGLESLAEEDSDLGGLDCLADEADFETGNNAYADLSEDQLHGIKEIHERLGLPENSWQETANGVLQLRLLKSGTKGAQLINRFNLVNDLLSVDIKQPAVLHKLEELHQFMVSMEEPRVVIDDVIFKPSGLIITPVDFVRKFYKVFYHDDNPAFDRLPDVVNDGFDDVTLTDRGINGVVLNQALSADRDEFEAMITPDLKEFQVKIMIRNSSSIILGEYVNRAMKQVNVLFPADDPYIESIRTGGGSFTTMQIATLIGSSQLKSIGLSFLFVFIVTFFIFRSLGGGLYSLVPLLFTVLLNFGLLAILGGQITMSTMLVASVAIGTGVDYTIHFLERLKIQLKQGDNLAQAYSATVMTSGRAILVNATAVAAGFLVFLFSTFDSQIMLGTLVAATMFLSSLGALTLLPAVILKTNPSFLLKVNGNLSHRN